MTPQLPASKRGHLRLLQGGKRDEDTARLRLYPERRRSVKAEPKPRPYTPPTRPAA